jgi:NitT/TauT family transport system permease protein
MLGIRSKFGDPVEEGWPHLGRVRGQESVFKSRLIVGNLVSGARLTVGFAVSVTIGGVLGVLMWRFNFLDELLGPLFLGLQTLPSVCWVPLSILVFGINEPAILFVLVMGSAFAIAIAMRDGLRIIPPIYQRAGLMMGARGWKLYRYVLLPASLPAMATSLRQGFSFAWRSLMGAELVFAAEYHGLGYLLELARGNQDRGGILAVMVVMIVIGMAMDRLVFARLQRNIQRRFGLA